MKVFIGPYKNNYKRNIKIKIHDYDLWNLDITIAILVLPLLKKLRKDNAGYPFIDNEDVPKRLRSNLEFDPDKWHWILDELIWTFKQIKNNDFIPSKKEGERINNGLKLFGKYYRHFWT